MPDPLTTITNERLAYLRQKAERARKIAKSAATEEIRTSFLAIAKSYDELADSFEALGKWRRQAPDPKPSRPVQGRPTPPGEPRPRRKRTAG